MHLNVQSERAGLGFISNIYPIKLNLYLILCLERTSIFHCHFLILAWLEFCEEKQILWAKLYEKNGKSLSYCLGNSQLHFKGFQSPAFSLTLTVQSSKVFHNSYFQPLYQVEVVNGIIIHYKFVLLFSEVPYTLQCSRNSNTTVI